VTSLATGTGDEARDIQQKHELEERVNTVIDALEDAHRHDRATAAEKLLLSPIAWSWLTTDAERRSESFQRVFSGADHDAHVAAREDARTTRLALEKAAAESRHMLLREVNAPEEEEVPMGAEQARVHTP
jgi:hypothetical protein